VTIIKYISILLIGILFVGCDAFKNEQSVPQELIGEWKLTGTGYGPNPTYEVDPNRSSMTLFLYNDRVMWYQDGEIWTKFGTTEKKKGWPEDSFYMNSKNNSFCDFKAVFNPETNTLGIIPANCLDFPSHFFQKSPD
jgi:hypothetical protein|tara:strand:- start:150 stop:560 length:411 start_codon:yes stop_codon:yes gene_type:complete